MSLNSLSIRGKLAGAFGALLFVLVAMGGVAVQQALALRDTTIFVANSSLPSADVLGRLLEAVARLRRSEATDLLVLAGRASQQTGAANAQRRVELREQAETSWKTFNAMVDGGENRRLADLTGEKLRTFLAQHDHFQEILHSSKPDDAFAYDDKEMGTSFAEVAGAVRASRDFNSRIAKQTAERAQDVVNQALWMIGGATLLGAVVAVFAAGWLNRNLTARVIRLSKAIHQLALHDYAAEPPGTQETDELGDMARALEECRQGLKAAEQMAKDQANEQLAKTERAARLETLARGLEANVGRMIVALATAAKGLQSTAHEMTGSTAMAAARSDNAADAAQRSNANVQHVAAAAEQLAGSISEITRQVARSSRMAGQAVEEAQRSEATVRRLSEGAQRISDVVNLIKGIAEQTNLLALNATIEAARAGEAGRGFAVVANEVKQLASETAKATDDITNQVSQIQSATAGAVGAIEGIGVTIREISSVAASIAAAVEQQGTATQEIARNVQQAAAGSAEVSRDIETVKRATDETGVGAGRVGAAAEGVSREAQSLGTEVEGFLAGFRAA